MTISPPADDARTKPRRRFFSWTGLWGRREAPPLNVVDSVTFQTPSRGEAFGFSVVARCCWCATGGRSRDDMKKAITERRSQDVRHIRRIVREAVRDLDPWQASAAEELANRGLGEQRDGVLAREIYDDDITTTCSAWVEIDVADRVRTYQQKEMRARLGWEAHSYGSKHALKVLTELRGDWLAFLGGDRARAHDDWRSPFATQLAESGGQVTETVASMHWRRRRDVSFAAAFYSDVIKEFRNAGHYDFAVSVEDTLDKMVRAYGLPKIDLVGEMLRDQLMAPDEAPMGHIFGSGADGEGPVAPFMDLFGERSSPTGDHDGGPAGSEETLEEPDAEALAETGEDEGSPDRPEDDPPSAADDELVAQEGPQAEDETGDER